MSDYPERINISPVHRQKRADDFYLVDRAAFPGKGTEYIRADHAQAEKAVSSATDECLLRELIRRNGVGSAPTSRAPVPPIEVLVGIGKDHHCFIALHKDALSALEEKKDD